MSDVNRIMFDAAVIRANESGEYTTNEEWAIQYAAGEIETLTTQLRKVEKELAEARAENERLRQAQDENLIQIADNMVELQALEELRQASGEVVKLAGPIRVKVFEGGSIIREVPAKAIDSLAALAKGGSEDG